MPDEIRGHQGFRCQKSAQCGFYKSLSEKMGLAFHFISVYCEGPGFKRCARYKLMSIGLDVPENLFPNGRCQHNDTPLPQSPEVT